MSNTAFRDRIKIGQSERDPSSFRKNELYSTSTPEPFKVEYTAFVENYKEVEKIIHRVFDKQRPNKDREFFNVSIAEAILAIRENSKVKYDEVFYKSPQEILKEEIRREEARKRQEEKIEKELEEKKRHEQRLLEGYKKKKMKLNFGAINCMKHYILMYFKTSSKKFIQV